MLHHRTDDPAERAGSIASREAEEVWEKTGDFGKYAEKWHSVYRPILEEFVYEG